MLHRVVLFRRTCLGDGWAGQMLMRREGVRAGSSRRSQYKHRLPLTWIGSEWLVHPGRFSILPFSTWCTTLHQAVAWPAGTAVVHQWFSQSLKVGSMVGGSVLRMGRHQCCPCWVCLTSLKMILSCGWAMKTFRVVLLNGRGCWCEGHTTCAMFISILCLRDQNGLTRSQQNLPCATNNKKCTLKTIYTHSVTMQLTMKEMHMWSISRLSFYDATIAMLLHGSCGCPTYCSFRSSHNHSY